MIQDSYVRSNANEPLIVLNMIVRNEEKIIGRCIESALPLIDAVVVLDTGSTDGTVEAVKKAAGALDVFVDRLPPDFSWPYGEFDFGTARTLGADIARARFASSSRLRDRYLLFLDADMCLVREEGFEKSILHEPHYRLIQRQGTLAYPNTRLGRMDFRWVSCEPTHEYWAPSPDEAPPSELFSLWIDDRDDGGAKGDKYERDVRLLTKRLKEDPKNVRAMYYLAQTHYYMAEKWFAERQRAGGWEGERWYAGLMLARSLAKSGKPEEGLFALLEAADAHGHRAEPLIEAARLFREKGRPKIAYGFAREALRRTEESVTSGSDLFVDVSCRVKATEEISISAYYVGRKEEGHAACEEVLRTSGQSEATYEGAERNLLFYVPEELDVVSRGRFEVPREMRIFPDSKGEDPVEYLTSSPSIVEANGGFIVNVRLVNYDHERGRWFVARHKDGVIRTENVLITGWRPDGLAMSSEETRISNLRIPTHWPRGRILGLEDVRLHWHGDRLWLSATTCQVPGSGDRSQVVAGYYDSAALLSGKVMSLGYGGTQECEKNWIPWSVGGRLRLIYSYEPFVVLDLDEETSRCREACRKTYPHRMARFRGSTSPVVMDGERWLMLVHERAHRDNDNVYLHRFLELSDGMESGTFKPEIVRVSRAFTFHHHGVEYAAGMVRSHDSRVIITYGAEERESHWCEFDTEKIVWL